MKKRELFGAYEVFYRLYLDDSKKLPFPLAFKIKLFLDTVEKPVREMIAERDSVIRKYMTFDMSTGEPILDQINGGLLLEPDQARAYDADMMAIFEPESDYNLDPDLYFTREELEPTKLSVVELENILWMVK